MIINFKKDLKFLKKIDKFQFDAIGLSYVQNHHLVKKIRLRSDKIIVSKLKMNKVVRI